VSQHALDELYVPMNLSFYHMRTQPPDLLPTVSSLYKGGSGKISKQKRDSERGKERPHTSSMIASKPPLSQTSIVKRATGGGFLTIKDAYALPRPLTVKSIGIHPA